MRTTSIASRLLLLSLAAVSSAFPATFSYYAELNNPSTTFSPVTNVVRTFFQPVAPIPPLNGLLAAGDTLNITFAAPTGKLFNILPTPSGGVSQGFAVSLWSDGIVGGTTSTVGLASFLLSGASKPMNAPTDSNFEFDAIARFKAQALFSQDDVSFKSITLTFLMPVGFSREFGAQVPEVYFDAFYISDSNAGPIATLIDDPNAPRPPAVPEPATVALTAFAFGGLLLLKSKRT